MKRTALALTLILALSASILAGMQTLEVAKANFIPEVLPSGIRIESDGTVNGTSNIQRNGNIYTLANNLDNTIVVLCDNIVVDGAGYTIQGHGTSSGIFIQARTNITIKDMRISNFHYGIKLTYGFSEDGPRNITVLKNTITNNSVGISLQIFSCYNFISGNNITGNGIGIGIYYSYGNTLRNNCMKDNEYNLWVGSLLWNSGSAFINDIDTSNTVNGKPVYYWINQQDKTIPSDAGYVGLVRCSNIIVQGLNLTHNGQGVLLIETNNSIVTGNYIAENNYGVVLFGTVAPCTNNTVSQNLITQNTENINTYLENSVNTIGDNTADIQINTPNPSLSSTPSPSTSPTPDNNPQQMEQLATILGIVIIAMVITAIGVSLLVYFKKRDRGGTG
jgi:parallel beta-helix repeat protein